MGLEHHKKRESPLDNEPDIADANMPDWFVAEKNRILSKIDTLNNQITSIPKDSSLRNLKAMMKETEKALRIRLDELEELTQVKTPTHRMISSKKNDSPRKD